MNIAKIILLLSDLPVLLTLIYTIVCFKKLNKALRVFAYFIFFSSFIQLLSLVFWLYRMNNLPLLHLYVPVGFVLLAWFYRTILGDFINKRIIWFSSILFSIFSIINSLTLQKVFTFNSNALTVESILIIILALFSFMVFLNDIVKQNSYNDIISLNWINSGLFIYHTSNLLIFYFGATIVSKFSVDTNLYTWILHAFFSIIMYCCFFISLWKRSRS
ncbi:hypothetical protein HNP25_001831 [Arcicella rosea]|uniref:YhhN-like protein n=1 Tax=Arcicella rosea TaxID=502909 RepID=A0A841EP80_9BACT|nr:hypothetical protein [Arcicella rosea]